MRELILKKIRDVMVDMGDGDLGVPVGGISDPRKLDLTLMSDEELLDLYDTFYGFIG